MTADITERVKDDPQFQELVATRNRLAIILTILMLLIYFGFIFLVAFWPGVLATKIAPGMVTTWGVPIGLGVIISAFVLTGIYVARANTEFDRMTHQIIERVK